MRIEEIREKFIKGEEVRCDVCGHKINVIGDRQAQRVVAAECSKNSNHYAVIVNTGRPSIAEMFKDSPAKVSI